MLYIHHVTTYGTTREALSSWCSAAVSDAAVRASGVMYAVHAAAALALGVARAALI